MGTEPEQEYEVNLTVTSTSRAMARSVFMSLADLIHDELSEETRADLSFSRWDGTTLLSHDVVELKSTVEFTESPNGSAD